MKIDYKLLFNNNYGVTRLYKENSSFRDEVLRDLHFNSKTGKDYFKMNKVDANSIKTNLLFVFKELGYTFLKNGIYFDYYEYGNKKFIKMKFTFQPNKYKIITMEMLENIINEFTTTYDITDIDCIEYVESRFNFILLWKEIK